MRQAAVLGDIVIGPHSGFTRWVFEAIVRLTDLLPGRAAQQIDRTDSVDFYSEPRTVFLTNYPSRQIVDAIEASDVRVLLVAEDPLDAIQYLRAALDLPAMEALRALTATSVAHLAIGTTRHLHVVRRTGGRPLRDVVSDIARHLGLPLAEDAIVGVAAAMSGTLGPDAGLEAALRQRDDAYAPPVRGDTQPLAQDGFLATASQVLDPLMAMTRGETDRPVVWPTEVFKSGDRPNEPAPRVAEIAGPARNIYYGPYLYLPPARYRVEAVLMFSDDIMDLPFVLEMHSSTWLAKARIERRKANHYRGFFALEHFDPTATIEIRLRNERGVQRGLLSLIELLFFAQGGLHRT